MTIIAALHRRLAIITALAAVITLGGLGKAQAAPSSFQLIIEQLDSGDNVIASSGIINWDGTSVDGANNARIRYEDNVGDFLIDIVTTISNAPGTASLAFLEVTSSVIENLASSDARIRISASATGYEMPSGEGNFLRSRAAGTATDGVIQEVRFDSLVGDNSLFDDSIASVQLTENNTTAFSEISLTSLPELSGQYSLSGIYTATFAANTRTTGVLGNTSVIVPEPASMAMVGLGLIGIPGLLYVQRRRQSTTA